MAPAFDDQRTGWLSEASGEYVVPSCTRVREPPPSSPNSRSAALHPGQLAPDGDRHRGCRNASPARANCPSRSVLATRRRWSTCAVATTYATLDYSGGTAAPVHRRAGRVQVAQDGQPAPGPAHPGAHRRSPGLPPPQLRFARPQARSNGNPGGGLGSSCGAVVDTADTNYQPLSKALGPSRRTSVPRLPKGSRGSLEGKTGRGHRVKESRSTASPTPGANTCSLPATPPTAGSPNTTVIERRPCFPNIPVKDDQAAVSDEGTRFTSISATSKAEVVQVRGRIQLAGETGETFRPSRIFVAPPAALPRPLPDKDELVAVPHAEPQVIVKFASARRAAAAGGCLCQPAQPWEGTHRTVCRAFCIWPWRRCSSRSFSGFRRRRPAPPAPGHAVPPPQRRRDSRRPRPSRWSRPARSWSNTPTSTTTGSPSTSTLVNKTTGEGWPAAQGFPTTTATTTAKLVRRQPQRGDRFPRRAAGTYYPPSIPNYSDTPTAIRSRSRHPGGAGWSKYRGW